MTTYFLPVGMARNDRKTSYEPTQRPVYWDWLPKLKISFENFSYTMPVKVQTQQPYQLRTYAWCWAIPPKCSRYKIQMKTVFKTEVTLKTVLINQTCSFFRWFLKSGQFRSAAKVSQEVQMEPLAFRSAGKKPYWRKCYSSWNLLISHCSKNSIWILMKFMI